MKIDAYVSERHKKRKKRRVVFYGSAALATLYFLAVGVFWLVHASPFFRLDNIIVKGNNEVKQEDVISLLEASAGQGFMDRILGFKNLLVWPGSVPGKDLALLPQLANVTTAADYFSNTLNVTVTERDHYGIWCFEAEGPAAKKCYWFDDTGTIFEKAVSAEGGIIFTVTDGSQNARGLNEKILPDEFVPNLVSILSVLRHTGLTVQSIELRDLGLEEVSVTIANGPALLFSLRFPADNYLPVIQSLMSRPGFSKLQYIDCRTENRVYYK